MVICRQLRVIDIPFLHIDIPATKRHKPTFTIRIFLVYRPPAIYTIVILIVVLILIIGFIIPLAIIPVLIIAFMFIVVVSLIVLLLCSFIIYYLLFDLVHFVHMLRNFFE